VCWRNKEEISIFSSFHLSFYRRDFSPFNIVGHLVNEKRKKETENPYASVNSSRNESRENQQQTTTTDYDY
jgi:hypothetical protein